MKIVLRIFLTYMMFQTPGHVCAQLSNIGNYSEAIPDSALYLGQTPPGNTPAIFAPGIVSLSGRNEARITFSPDGKSAFYYIEFWPNPGTPFIMYSEYKNGTWTNPDTASFARNRKTGEPFFALGGKRIYLNSTKALNQVGSIDLSYVEKKDSSWSDPVSLGSPPNSTQDQYHACIVADTSIYFSSSSGEICRCQYRNGAYQARVVLPYPINFANTTQTWGDPYVSPDESYLVFKSTRTGGYGGNDIYISYKKADGSWTNPKNLGDKINTAGDETSGDITPDGKYMTFGRGGDLYWVSASFIDSLKHTNFVPYAKSKISDQIDTIWHPFSLVIPDSIFVDDDGNETLTYSAALTGGSALPSWLHFDPLSKTLSGNPTNAGTYDITITATDTANASATCAFKLNVRNVISIDYLGQTPPGDSAVVFTPGTVWVPDRLEHAGVFSPDGKEFYFSVVTNNWSTLNTYVRKCVNGSWTPEELASFSSVAGGAAETFINNKNNRIFFVSSGQGTTSDGWLKTDFWTAERSGDAWVNPKKLDAMINDIDVQWHPTISDSGHVYFGSKGSIFVATQLNDTTFGEPTRLSDAGVNQTGSNNAEPWIAPDEKYLLFSSSRSGGYGNSDLYISYKKADNTWTKPLNLGPKINSAETDFSPYVTPDGKYLLFAKDDGVRRHIYWVSTRSVDSLKGIATDVNDDKSVVPRGFNLFQNFPNPFNPSTLINYQLPVSSHVVLNVYDALGREVKALVNERQKAGYHEVKFDGTRFSSGVYIYRLSAGNFVSVKKMLMVK